MATTEFETEPGSQGKGCGSSALAIIVAVLVVLALACCGGGVYFYRAVMPEMMEQIEEELEDMAPATTDNPAEIRAKTAEITEIEIPDRLEPRQSMSMTMPFGNFGTTTVVYSDDTSSSMLVLFMFTGDDLADMDTADLQRQMDSQTAQLSAEDVDVESSRQITTQVRGQEASFTIVVGKGQQSGESRIKATGVIKGKSGPTTVVVDVDAEEFSEEEVVTMLESIK